MNLDNHLTNLMQQREEVLSLAKKYHRLHAAAKRRLKKFSLFVRIFKYKRFKKLRTQLWVYDTTRFKYTAVMLHLSRSIKFYRRQKVRKWNQ